MNPRGIGELLGAVASHIIPRRPLACFAPLQPLFEDKAGLEIGGPTHVFRRRSQLPIYPLAGRMDNCNFSSQTVWEGNISEGARFPYDKSRPLGHQFIGDATDLTQIPSEAYDFLLSSHALEHIANPIKALTEWLRVMKDGGTLVLLLPHKERTFDHRRPVTPLDHLLEDFAANVGEDDLTHLNEILELHDLSMDPKAGDSEAFRQRSLKNIENRCLHHHVFDIHLAMALVHHMGLEILAATCFRPNNILVIARKAGPGPSPQNKRFIAASHRAEWSSPFAWDHRVPGTKA